MYMNLTDWGEVLLKLVIFGSIRNIRIYLVGKRVSAVARSGVRQAANLAALSLQ